MARWLQPCSLVLLFLALAVVATADDDKCTSCGLPSPCGTTCVYASPPPPVLPPPVYNPPPAPVYNPPPAPVYNPPPSPVYPPATPSANCPPPPYGAGGGGGGYNPTPGGYNPTPGGGGYNPTPSGWFTPPNMPSYLTPPGTLYPQDPGFRPNAATGGVAMAWRAVVFSFMAATVAGALAL